MTDTHNHELSGLFVVSLEQAVAAPYVASRLADAGARVVKGNVQVVILHDIMMEMLKV